MKTSNKTDWLNVTGTVLYFLGIGISLTSLVLTALVSPYYIFLFVAVVMIGIVVMAIGMWIEDNRRWESHCRNNICGS